MVSTSTRNPAKWLIMIAILAGNLNEPSYALTSVTRHYQGDIYMISATSNGSSCGNGSSQLHVPQSDEWQCQCNQATPTYRDDTLTCIHQLGLNECPLADFVSVSGSEKIPYVYIPLKGQLIHPTAEVALLGLEDGDMALVSPVCVVTKAEVLTSTRWELLSNNSFEPPFRLYRESDRTYLQWVGEEKERNMAEGRLVLVSLICRDTSVPEIPLFRPCVAFRVAGTLGDSATLSPLPSQDKNPSLGLSSQESIVIGFVITCLAVVYIIAMTIYLKIRSKRKKQDRVIDMIESGDLEADPRSNPSVGGRTVRSHRSKRPPQKPSLVSSEDDSDHEDMEDLSQRSKYRINGQMTQVVVHGASRNNRSSGGDESDYAEYNSDVSEHQYSTPHYEPGDDERVPPSTVSVIETSSSDLRSQGRLNSASYKDTEEPSSEVPCGSSKKKLYFNPAYFEPELLQSPPPAALEFLTKIREMISVAKIKMRNKSFHPSLIDIPEDEYELPGTLPRQSRDITTMRVSRNNVHGKIISENEYCNVDFYNDNFDLDNDDEILHNISHDSLEKNQDSDSRSSTLRKLAKRVNSHGQSFVSEIIKNLDLKPRFPETIYGTNTQPKKSPQPKIFTTTPKPVNAREIVAEVENDYPELIKPSMIRSVLKDGKRLTDLNNTFESFRHEMMATFNKMKKVGEAISPKSTLTRHRNKNQQIKSNTLQPETKSGERKVNKWLQTLENKIPPYSRMPDAPNSIVPGKGIGETEPPPLPLRNYKPPTPPRRHKAPNRSISFNEISENSIKKSLNSTYGNNDNTHFISNSNCLNDNSIITRSHSWTNEHRHYDSAQRMRKSVSPPDDDNNSFGSEDDSLSDLLSEAESKLPKVVPSDSDSVYSDSKSNRSTLEKYKDSNTGELSLKRHLKVEDGFYSNDISIVRTKSHKNKTIYSNENPYEEIRYDSKESNSKKRKNSPKLQNKNKLYNIYSDPDSLVSEVQVHGEKVNSEPIYSGTKISIPLQDNIVEKNEDLGLTSFDQDTLERKIENFQRSNSIHQDSLERPKFKDNKITTDNRLHGSTPDLHLISLYEARSGISVKNDIDNTRSQERIISPTRKETVSLGNKSGKKLKTFKDYQELKFQRTNGSITSENSEGNSSLIIRSLSPANRTNSLEMPPLPPKQLRSLEGTHEISPELPPKKGDILKPPLPMKGSPRKLETDYHDGHKPKLPEKVKKGNLKKSNSLSSDQSIPALTEEEARSILHGLLAHTIPSEDPGLAPFHEGKDNHFLGLGNTAVEHNSLSCSSVPEIGNMLASLPTNNNFKSVISIPVRNTSNIDNFDGNFMNIKQFDADRLSSLNSSDENELTSSSSEDIVSGEFILSTIGRSTSLRRQTSLNRDRTANRVLATIKDLADGMDENTQSMKSMGMEIALALKAKSLEKHFKEKSGADSIKRTWRKILEKVEDTKEDKDNVFIQELQTHFAHKEKFKDIKQKQDDSGYQSTDSTESKNDSTASGFNNREFKSRKASLADTKHSRVKRSLSMQSNTSSTQEFKSRSTQPSSYQDVGKHHIDNNSSMSIYVNNGFSIDGSHK